MQLDHFPYRAVRGHRHVCIATIDRRAAGDGKIVELEREGVAPLDATVQGQRLYCLLRSERRKVPSMAFFRGAFDSGFTRLQLFRRVLVDADVHAEVRFLEFVAVLLRGPGTQQALVHEFLHRVHRRWRIGPAGKVQHRLGRLEREAALECRALGKGRLLPRREQVPGPVDRCPECCLPRCRAAGAGEKTETVAHPLHELRGREHAHSRRSKLDRQRQPIEQPHELGHRGAVGVTEDEVGPLRAGALGEQFDRVPFQGQRLDRKTFLARDVQPFAAGHDKGGVGSLVEPAADRGSRMLRDLLEVVENQQAATAAGDGVTDARSGVLLAERNAERRGDGEIDAVERARFRQIREVDAARPVSQPDPAIAAHKAGLAGTSRADDGEQPRSCVESRRQGAEVTSPADEGVTLGRKGMADLAHGTPLVLRANHAVCLVDIRRR